MMIKWQIETVSKTFEVEAKNRIQAEKYGRVVSKEKGLKFIRVKPLKLNTWENIFHSEAIQMDLIRVAKILESARTAKTVKSIMIVVGTSTQIAMAKDAIRAVKIRSSRVTVLNAKERG